MWDRTFHEVSHPSSDISDGVRSSWTFHRPAPSALVLSQHFSGLLLRTASLSYFVQAPPLGFKEQSGRTGERFATSTRSALAGAPRGAEEQGRCKQPNDCLRGSVLNRTTTFDNLGRAFCRRAILSCHSPMLSRTRALGGGHDETPFNVQSDTNEGPKCRHSRSRQPGRPNPASRSHPKTRREPFCHNLCFRNA